MTSSAIDLYGSIIDAYSHLSAIQKPKKFHAVQVRLLGGVGSRSSTELISEASIKRTTENSKRPTITPHMMSNSFFVMRLVNMQKLIKSGREDALDSLRSRCRLFDLHAGGEDQSERREDTSRGTTKSSEPLGDVE